MHLQHRFLVKSMLNVLTTSILTKTDVISTLSKLFFVYLKNNIDYFTLMYWNVLNYIFIAEGLGEIM